MSAEKFLDELESKGLIDDAVIGNLRKQVAKSSVPIVAETVATLLVEKGQLTSFQAKNLMS